MTTAPVASRSIRVARAVLIGLGALLLGVAGGTLVSGVPIRQWPAILLWLAGAVILHDAIFAPLVLVGTRILRRVGARVSWAQIAVVQIALVLGAALTFIAIPAIRSQQLGARNPSVLVFPYAPHLAIAWAAIGAVTAVVVLGIGIRRRRRQKGQGSSDGGGRSSVGAGSSGSWGGSSKEPPQASVIPTVPSSRSPSA